MSPPSSAPWAVSAVASAAAPPHNNNVLPSSSRVIIPITVTEPGKLGINITESKADGSALVVAVFPNAPMASRKLRPGDSPAYLDTTTNKHVKYPFATFIQSAASVRPFHFFVVRTVLHMRFHQARPLGYTVEAYQQMASAERFTRIASVELNGLAHTAGLRVGDLLCAPGTGGDVLIPYEMFVFGLSYRRPLMFDVLRPEMVSTSHRNATRPSHATTTRIKAERATTGSSRSKNNNTMEVIELLDSEEETTTTVGATANRTTGSNSASSSSIYSSYSSTSRASLPVAGPARTGRATHFQPNKMRFPPFIDTLFDGSVVENKIPPRARGLKYDPISGQAGKLAAISHIQRSTNKIADLKYIWPMETPVPEATGGFFEMLSKPLTPHQPPAKKAKGTGKGRKTHSRIGRLAGTITLQLHVATRHIYNAIQNKTHAFFLAEDLLLAEQRGEYTQRSMSEESRNILEAISALNDCKNPFKDRCLYVIGESLKLPAFPRSGQSHIFVDIKLHVYFRRALFGLSACPSTKVVLDALQPVSAEQQRLWVPCRQVPASSGRFTRSPVDQGNNNAGRFHHTLPGLLWANESTGYNVSSNEGMPSYEGAKVALRDYQKETVGWMRQQEDLSQQSGGGVPGLNGYFWERRSFADSTGDEYYYFPLGGHVLLNPPPIVSGGLLAEEMGLGKTVEVIELICSDAAVRPKSNTIVRGGTLVVLPVSLLTQWKDEMDCKAPHLSVEIYNGDRAKLYEQHQRRGAKTLEDLGDFDVVLTTMSKLQQLTRRRTAGTINILDKCPWHRLVIDECQYLKNDTTVIAKAASAIDAQHIWMLSGTPLTNRLDDLRGELSLLRVWPFTLGTSSDEGWLSHFWDVHVKEPWDKRDKDCLPVVRSLMSAVSIRHSRLQKRVADGSPLVELPPRTEQFVAVREPSDSHETFINRWLEATAGNLLDRLGRMDVRILGQILQLRKVVTSGALLSLERVNEAQKLLAREDLLSSGPLHEFRQMSIRSATLEFKRQAHLSSVILQELSMLQNGVALSSCSYCKGPRMPPVYLTCDHSLCSRCCKSLIKTTGNVVCPTCRSDVPVGEIVEVLPTNPNIGSVQAPSLSCGDNVPLDLTMTEEEQMTNLLKLTDEDGAAVGHQHFPIDVDSDKPLTKYLDADADFQKNMSITHTLDSLKNLPSPNVSVPPYLLADFPHVPKALAKHIYACQEHREGPSAKIKAIVDEIKKIRSSSLEAKICVFSSFAGCLNELEEALSSITYDILMETIGKGKLKKGDEVTELQSGRVGKVKSDSSSSTWDSKYRIVLEGSEQVTVLSRREVALEPARVRRVPSTMIRRDNGTILSVNGSNDRFETGDHVQSKRPPVPSTELRVGYSVHVEEGDQWHTGKITAVYRGENGVCYDVKQSAADGGRDMSKVPPCRIEDLGDINSYRPAVIQNIYSDGTSVAQWDDSYAHAIGYVRLDGSAGNAELRGEKLNVFRNDPMTSVALLTKRAAGVCLNLTNANYAIIMEPSEDAHDEVQSICRVHRIGQTRRVKVLKFFVEGSIEERILKRRQQRGELTVSINALAGGGASDDEEEEADSNKKEASDAAVSASRAMTFADLKLLLGK